MISDPSPMGMRKLTLASFCLFVSFAVASQPKGTLVIIGGGERPPSIVDRMIQESGLRTGGFGVVLPMSSASDSAVYYAAEPFRKAGITNLYGLRFRKGETPSQSGLDSIRKAKLIYITGGDQNRFMAVVEGTSIKTAIQEAYRNGTVVAGTSAGAAVMCENMITGNQLRDTTYTSTFRTIESKNLEIKPGLALVTGVLIDQHFLARSRHNRLLTGVIEYPDHVGIGIDESTAIVVKGKAIEVIGDSQVLVIENPGRSRKQHGSKLVAKGLLTSIYVAGEKFMLK